MLGSDTGAVRPEMPMADTCDELCAQSDGLDDPACRGLATRFRAELAWLLKLEGLSPSAAAILAARSAATAIGYPDRTTAQIPALFQGLMYGLPDQAVIHDSGRCLARKDRGFRLTPEDMARLADAWPLTAWAGELLTSGGDERLTLNPKTGLNRYGCSPLPRESVVGFSSCTASSLSAGAFAAVEARRRTLVADAVMVGYERALAGASGKIAVAILDAFQCADLADAVLTASGTDAALVVTGLLAAERPQSLMTSILVSPAETGSGVPHAVQGCHFAGVAASGCSVSKGELVHGLPAQARLATIALRDQAGQPLDTETVSQACEAAILRALPHGHVVLHAIDGSKTGLTAPGCDTLLELAQRFGPALDIVVDACQARVEPALVRWYLQQGFPVLITGSKFFGAPGFCGAVLFPRARLARLATSARLPAGLASYVQIDASLGSRQCPGLLLRWTAALHEMRRFGQVSTAEIGGRLQRLGGAIRTSLQRDGRLRLVDAPRPAGMGWSDQRSVFTFAIQKEGGWMAPEQLREIYLALQDDCSNSEAGRSNPALAARRCQIGQPVQLGSPELGGLRIAISAADVSDDRDQTQALVGVVEKLRLLLDADERLAGSQPRGTASALL